MKLDRAEAHFKLLDRRIKEFLKGDFYFPVPENHGRGRLMMVATRVKQPPDSLPLMVGDTVHNLRSALDHLAWQLAIPRGGGEPPTGTEFPIFWRGADYRARKRNGKPAPGSGLYKTRGFRRGSKTIVESLQPYHRRKHPENGVLWHIHELDRFDKHRLLLAAAGSFVGSRFAISSRDMVRLRGVKFLPGVLKEGAPFAELRLDSPEARVVVDVETHLAADIVFAEGCPASVRGESVSMLLKTAIRFLRREVLPRFEPPLR